MQRTLTTVIVPAINGQILRKIVPLQTFNGDEAELRGGRRHVARATNSTVPLVTRMHADLRILRTAERRQRLILKKKRNSEKSLPWEDFKPNQRKR
jgi:hypothetical protein